MNSFRCLTAAAGVCLAASLGALPAGEKPDAPTISFEKGDVTKALTECPGGKVKIELSGGVAQLSEAKTGKRIGSPLAHDKAEANVAKSIVVCWAFSPDGKLVATGSRCALAPDGSEGQVCVWDVTTGARVAEYRGSGKAKSERIGNVTGVAFAEDGKTVRFQAKAFAIDGP
jgi:WD40 repeat protein